MPKQGCRLSQEAIQSIRAMLDQGESGAEIARRLNVSKNTVCAYIKKEGWRKGTPQRATKQHNHTVPEDYSTAGPEVLFDHRKYPVF